MVMLRKRKFRTCNFCRWCGIRKEATLCDCEIYSTSNEVAVFECRSLWMSCEEKIPDREST